MDYANLSFYEALELPIDLFLLMRKNYITQKLKQTPEGVEYLQQAERLNVTKPERGIAKKLESFKKKAVQK